MNVQKAVVETNAPIVNRLSNWKNPAILTGQIEFGSKPKKYYVYKNSLIDCESDEVLIDFKET